LIVFRELTNSKHVGSGMMGKCTGYQNPKKQKHQSSTETINI